jgi:3-methyladenine DNA glycosylase/8-oxoguanine DNA glycosylase
MLAFYGQGRYDRVPAGDLGYLKLVGRLTTGDPQARVDVPEAYAFFAPFGSWRGLAAEYLRVAAGRGLLPARAAPGSRVAA